MCFLAPQAAYNAGYINTAIQMKRIEYPFTLNSIKDLKCGERIIVSGRVITARDRAHKYLFEGNKCPVELKDGAIYHCGPVVIQKDGKWVVRAAGPTTSMRQEPYTAKIIEQYHPRLIIGKGGMGEGTRKACIKYGCVYLQTVGGAASWIARNVEKVASVHLFKEFGYAEALWEFFVKDMEAIVAIDTRGRSIHKRIQLASKRRLNNLL